MLAASFALRPLPFSIDRAVALFAVLVPSLAATGCIRDHDLLGVDPPVSSQASSGTGGAGGGGGGAGGEGGTIVEPPGPTKLTVVNGVNDYDAIRVCFVPYPDGTGAGLVPWPDSVFGLGFGRGKAISPIDTVVPPATDVRVHVVAGFLKSTGGLDCEQLLTAANQPGSGLVVAALPVLPASVFEVEKSLLLVPMGCLGGKDHAHPEAHVGCGEFYSPTTPSANLVAVAMSRLTDPQKIGFQVVHASMAMGTVDVRLLPGFNEAVDLEIFPKLSVGAIGPFPPFWSLGEGDFGAFGQVKIRTFNPGDITATSTVWMSTVLPKSGLEVADFVNGKGFVLVAVGAAPGAAAGPFWHPLTYALVNSDP